MITTARREDIVAVSMKLGHTEEETNKLIDEIIEEGKVLSKQHASSRYRIARNRFLHRLRDFCVVNSWLDTWLYHRIMKP